LSYWFYSLNWHRRKHSHVFKPYKWDRYYKNRNDNENNGKKYQRGKQIKTIYIYADFSRIHLPLEFLLHALI